MCFQIPLVMEDIPKMAVTTPFSLYEFTQMPINLRNATQSFQRLMDQILIGLPFIYAYIDNILIASRTSQTLHQIFQRLSKFGLKN